jgi:hypothetical protein
MRERMHFSLELAAPVSESGVRHRPPRLRSADVRWLRWKSPPCSGLSGMNYTTLGDSDKVMSPAWRLLASLEAANGMLMFGVSTAMLFAVIQRLFQTRFSEGTSYQPLRDERVKE